MGAIYVGKKLGVGGFEKEVVLKQLLPEFTSRPEFRDLFFREAKISATLDHQNIVRTFDLVKTSDRLFIVMEYVRGADLRTIAWRARRRKPLSLRAILHVAMEILAGLGYAHSRKSAKGEPLGIIHRDLSPSNILCSGEGEAKLSDFGIAKAVTYSSVFYRVRGKVGYMSPEMARNQPLDARSDLFSMGVSIYETILGERIYTGDLNTPPDKIYAQTVPLLASRSPGVPPELQQVLNRALALDREERYANAEEFSHAIRQVVQQYDLFYSAPEFAAELREIMGPNAESWLADERENGLAKNAQAADAQANLAGKDADSVVESGASELPPPSPALKPPSGESTAPERPRAPPPSLNMAIASTTSSAQLDAVELDGFAVTPVPQSPAAGPAAPPAVEPARTWGMPLPSQRVGGVAALRRTRNKGWWLLLLGCAVAAGFFAARFLALR